MEWEPRAKPDVVKVVTPPLRVPVPRLVFPSKNVTIPVAAEGVTVAVNVTGALKGDGFADEFKATADACLTF